MHSQLNTQYLGFKSADTAFEYLQKIRCLELNSIKKLKIVDWNCNLPCYVKFG